MHEKLKSLRALSGLTQKQFGKLIKASERTIESWESSTNGREIPPKRYIAAKKLVDLLIKERVKRLASIQRETRRS